MKICKNCNLDFDDSKKFCDQCGQRLFATTDNKIDKFAQEVSIFTSTLDRNIKNFQSEFESSETAKKLNKTSQKLIEFIIIILGIAGTAILFFNLVSIILNKEETFLYEILNPRSESIYYKADFTTKFELLMPSLVLPTLLTLIASFKRFYFLIGLSLCFVILEIASN